MMSCIDRDDLQGWRWQPVFTSSFITLLFIALGAALPNLAQANRFGSEVATGQITRGSLVYRLDDGGRVEAPLLDTDVSITVTGLLARAKVRQRFSNDTDSWVEGVYLFPLPDDAAVDRLHLRIGERVIKGKIMEKQAAKTTYQRAKRSGRRASLLSQQRPNLFTTAVANIAPGESVTVEIEYQQSVHFNQGEFSLRFPITFTPRFNPGQPRVKRPVETSINVANAQPLTVGTDTDQVPDASQITAPIAPQGQNQNPVRLQVDLAPGFEVASLSSAYHQVNQQLVGAARYRVELEPTMHDSNQDFELRWRPLDSGQPLASWFTQSDKDLGQEQALGQDQDTDVQSSDSNYDGHYNYLMLMPPSAPAVEPPVRDVVFVIDTSGSMGGEPLRQAREALLLAIARLNAQDRFNLIEFNSHSYRLFDHERPATESFKARAMSYVRGLESRGGTNMLPALEMALPGVADYDDAYEDNSRRNNEGNGADRLRQIVFLTDGAVGNEDQLLELISRRLGEGRLFTIGIGAAPNSYFMRKAAEAGRGSYTFIGKVDEIQQRMDALFRKLEAPALVDIRVEFDGVDMSFAAASGRSSFERYPQHMPDLYRGEPVVLAFRSETLPQQVRIRGTHNGHNGQPWVASVAADQRLQREGVAVHWARRKLGSLTDRYRVSRNVEARQQLQNKITSVALQHHLVSRFTSLVAVEQQPVRPLDQALQRRMLKSNPPQGTQFGLPQTATSAARYLLSGLLLCLVALCGWLLSRRGQFETGSGAN